jgi:hypothetical protein
MIYVKKTGPPTANQHRDWLRSLANEVHKRLRRLESSVLQLAPAPTVGAMRNLYGWAADIGRLAAPGTDDVSIYFDYVPGTAHRTIWAGFFVSGEARVRHIASLLKSRCGKAMVLPHARFGITNGVVRLNPALSKRDLGTPVIEMFRGYAKTYGVYLSEVPRLRAGPARTLARDAADFLRHCVEGLEHAGSARTRTWHREKEFKNRKITVTTRIFLRSSAQAQQVKSDDGWTCRVCGFAPEVVYGLQGRACLDAHHVKALHTKGRRATTTLSDLITVCANCHRVLGKLAPDERGLSELRARLKKRKRMQPRRIR